MSDSRPIGLIAGAGSLPVEAVDCLADEGHAAALFAFDGISDDAFGDRACWTRLGELERLCGLLQDAKVEDLLIVGKFDRSILLAGADRLAPDAEAIALLGQIGDRPDEGFMAAIANWLEGRGFNLRRQDHLLSSLLAGQGALSAWEPDMQMQADLDTGIEAVAHLGNSGNGQAVAVKEGVVVATEAAEGTDEMIARAGKIAGPGFTLVKGIRPGQDRRFDLPAVGRDTVDALARVSARGLAVEAGSTLLVAADSMLGAADDARLAVYGWSAPRRGV